MACDIVLAKKSYEFIESARKLGFDKIIFAQHYDTNLNFGEVDAVIARPASKDELRKLIDKIEKEKKLVIVETEDEQIVRKALESKKIFALFTSLALNHVLCKIASQNNIAIGISLKEILKKKGKERASLLARAMQNIKLCRKYKARLKIVSLAEKPQHMARKHDLHALCLSLGMSTAQAKEAIEN